MELSVLELLENANHKNTYQRYGLLSHVPLLVRDRDEVPENKGNGW